MNIRYIEVRYNEARLKFNLHITNFEFCLNVCLFLNKKLPFTSNVRYKQARYNALRYNETQFK